MESDYLRIKKNVLERIKPGDEERERVDEVTRDLVGKISPFLKRGCEVITVGSVAKGTFLSKDRDIDIFIVFDETLDLEGMRRVVRRVGRAVFGSFEERYAQHPYIRAIYRGFEIDLVPALRFSSGAGTGVDRTPKHTRFVLEKIGDNPGLVDGVLLLKQFAKGIGIYGAEARVQGISGYLCELFILKYGSFESFLDAAGNLAPHNILTMNGSFTMRTEWKNAPLVFVDPVDSKRNVASSLSHDCFELMKRAAGDFLREPRITFFFPNDPSLSEKFPGEKLIVMDLSNALIPNIEDIYYPQLRRSEEIVTMFLKDFGVEKSAIYCDRGRNLIFFQLSKKRLEETYVHAGPPLNLKESVEMFVKRWGSQNCFMEGEKIYTVVKRDLTRPAEIIKINLPSVRLGKGIDNGKVTFLEDISGIIDVDIRRFLIKCFSGEMLWGF